VTLQRPLLIKLLLPLVAFGVTIFALSLVNRSSSPPRIESSAGGNSFGAPGRSTDDRIRALQAALRANPRNPDRLAVLGDAYLQKVRETGDSAYYVRAQAVLERASNQAPRNPAVLAGMGSLALARHDFRGGLRFGREARAAAPGVVRIYGVVVDALVELGRYDQAARELQRMVDLKPNLASYARVSYFRELHGDLAGAVRAMRLAVSAGGDAPENLAYVQTLLGNLEFERGRIAAAQRAYRLALARFPRYVPASAGLARADAARGRLGTAIRRYREVVTRLPLPEYVIGLGETELATGRRAAARRDLALVPVEQRLLQSNGVNTDVELALFQANHGDPATAVRLARRSWRAAPSVRSADALGWSSTRSGQAQLGLSFAKRALALGSRDPMFLYHAGIAAKAAGRSALARRYLARSLATNPRFSPLYAPRARRALEAVGR